MLLNEILKLAEKKQRITTQDVVKKYNITRQYAYILIDKLVRAGKLIKIGSTRSAFYTPPQYYDSFIQHKKVKKRLQNKNLKEHEVYDNLEKQTPILTSLKEDIKSIFYYAFTEMLNNAIEHSKSKYVKIEVEQKDNNLIFYVDDLGIGVFKNVMQKRKLTSELEAIQDLLKGKTTTKPKSHSGQGIFFTSKIADVFALESFGYRLTVDNTIPDFFVEEIPSKRGTRVIFSISLDSKKHLNDIFKKYQTNPEDYAFDKTEIHVRLYTMGTIYISRSQARRILASLEKFRLIILDFDRVPTVGQAFADEIFRVFQKRHPEIAIKPVNMNETVRFMIERSQRSER